MCVLGWGPFYSIKVWPPIKNGFNYLLEPTLFSANPFLEDTVHDHAPVDRRAPICKSPYFW